MHRAAFVTAFLLAVALTSGCGSDTIDSDEVEQQIEEQVSTATTAVASVSCPSDVEKEEGAKFECDVELSGGGRAIVTVTQQSGNEFTYQVKEGTMRVADDSLEPYLEEELAGEGVSAQVDCPDLVNVKAGKTATCDVATAGGRQTTLTFTWEDDAGSVDASSVKTTSG